MVSFTISQVMSLILTLSHSHFVTHFLKSQVVWNPNSLSLDSFLTLKSQSLIVVHTAAITQPHPHPQPSHTPPPHIFTSSRSTPSEPHRSVTSSLLLCCTSAFACQTSSSSASTCHCASLLPPLPWREVPWRKYLRLLWFFL